MTQAPPYLTIRRHKHWIFRLISLFQDAYLLRHHDSMLSALKMPFSTESGDVRNILKVLKSLNSLG